VPWPKEYRAKDYFCFKHTRTVTNDNTIPFDGHRLQIPPGPNRRSYAKAKVEVQQHLDGQLEIRYQGKSLATFQPADELPVRVKKFTPFLEETPKKQAQPNRLQNPKNVSPSNPQPIIPGVNRCLPRKGRKSNDQQKKTKDERELLEKVSSRLPFWVKLIILDRWRWSR
jgi:hypothetical protein